ncbi:hypothetical protein A5888_002720 [Enterococcus sp. 9E7_DIV0242]|uniref:Uncharacterized protein n=1 Tax=Candidatus Enterococcus clewellii TaxID=1834193 RepID=A0A242K852_9ENTE|nr:hypothetical protein A5888_001481 [Enterococcus sp. 9E7_DIV0242]
MFKLSMKKGTEIKAGKLFCLLDINGYRLFCINY